MKLWRQLSVLLVVTQPIVTLFGNPSVGIVDNFNNALK